MADLLLHSLSEFREIIFALIEASSPKHIVEIGSETGTFTQQVVDWALAHDATVTTIDPFPAAELRKLSNGYRLVEAKSPAALRGLPPGEVYLIDGDHNYHTVSQELVVIHETTRDHRPPLLILHDVGWPCARRDQYYDPSDIPDHHRHDLTYERGIELDNADTVQYGFRGNGQFAYATREGGERNGVLTAVESFLAAHDQYAFYVIPAIFGLGIVVRRDHRALERVESILGPYHNNPLIRRLDENRLRNYLRVIALQDEAQAHGSETKAIQSDRDRLAAENLALAQRYESLRTEYDALHTRLRDAEDRIERMQNRWYARYASAIESRLKRR